MIRWEARRHPGEAQRRGGCAALIGGGRCRDRPKNTPNPHRLEVSRVFPGAGGEYPPGSRPRGNPLIPGYIEGAGAGRRHVRPSKFTGILVRAMALVSSGGGASWKIGQCARFRIPPLTHIPVEFRWGNGAIVTLGGQITYSPYRDLLRFGHF